MGAQIINKIPKKNVHETSSKTLSFEPWIKKSNGAYTLFLILLDTVEDVRNQI